MLISINRPHEVEQVIAAVRLLRPDIRLIVRARDAEHARKLYEAGATDAVPETIEASLQLSEAALVGVGVPTGLVIASIHEKRDEFRAALQGAGGYAGQAGHGSVHGRAEVKADADAGDNVRSPSNQAIPEVEPTSSSSPIEQPEEGRGTSSATRTQPGAPLDSGHREGDK